MPPSTRTRGVTTAYRPVWAEIDLGAVRANVRALREHCAPARLLAVVKADGYGHGAVPVARAALEAGAIGSGRRARRGGHRAPRGRASTRRSSCSRSRFPRPRRASSRYGLTPVVYTLAGIDALAKAVADRGAHDRLGVHLKVDTGMHRVGLPRRRRGRARARRWSTGPSSSSPGVCTHLAVADEPGNPYTAEQLARFDAVLDGVPRARPSDRHRARVEHRGRDRLARGPLRHGARRDRDLRHRARRRARGARRAAAGDVGEGARLAREARSGAARGCRTGCATRPTARPASRPCRSATPTACRASCRIAAARRSCAAAGARWRARSRWTS